MNGEARSFVCAFGDLESGLGGMAWDLGEPAALLLSGGEVRQATFGLERDLDTTTVQITADDEVIDATLTPARTLVAHPNPENPVELRAAASIAEVRPKGGGHAIECAGQLTEWVGDPLDGAGLLRHLGIGSGPDSLLIATARGLPGAEGHGSEHAGGWLLRGDGGTPFDETLISTQYDADGRPSRIGLELWPEDADTSSRAAATRVSGSLLGGFATGSVWAGLFRCHTDGTEGLGSYLLWRA
jgi:hypothetical protein